MQNMKRIFNYLLIAFLATISFVSCFPETDYTHSAVVTANFEYTDVKFDSDSIFFKSVFGDGIGWGTLGFFHKIDTVNWIFEGGALLSCQEGTLYDPADMNALSKNDSLVFAQDRYRVNSVKDTVNNNAYLVYYMNPDPDKMPKHDVEFLVESNGVCLAQQCYVNNTAYVAYKVAQTFQPGDRLTLKATGYLKGTKTGEASMHLADFSAQKDSIVSTWTAFDLTKLGSFDVIDFEVLSTKEEVPAYFCMDHFTASVTISSGNL